jgi:hypothetical protein
MLDHHHQPARHSGLRTRLLHRLAIPCLLFGLTFLSASCTHFEGLTVAPQSKVLPGEPDAAVASAAGVRLVIRPGAWSGNPPDLSESVLPLQVTLENHSSHCIDMQRALFTLRGPTLDYEPLAPPALVQKTVKVRRDPLYVLQPDSTTWMRTGGKSGSLATLAPNDGSPPVFVPHYATSVVSLPTTDMIDRALPKKNLQPGETVSGFLYYERPPQTVRSVRFTLDLIDASSSLTFGHLMVPLSWHG